nr:hypothetical protein [Tanacetum cinerariifolium]
MLVPLPLLLSPLLLLVWISLEDLAYGKVSKTTDQALGLLKVNFVRSGLVSINPTPDPSTHDDWSMNSVYGSCGVSITDASDGASSGFLTKKSARIWPFIDVQGRYVILCSPSMTLYFCNHPATSGRDITCLMGWSVMTTIGCSWKYLRNLLAAQTCARTSCFKAYFASPIQWKSPFLMHFFKVLKSGKDFSANLEMNLQASQLPVETLDFFDCPWGWEL